MLSNLSSGHTPFLIEATTCANLLVPRWAGNLMTAHAASAAKALHDMDESMDIQEAVQACCSRLGRPLGSAELQLVCYHADVLQRHV